MTSTKLERIVLPDGQGQDVPMHVLRPRQGQALHAVVLLPAIAGINAYVTQRAAQLRDAGYLVVVVDYFSRSAEQPDLSTLERIQAAVAGIDDRRVLQDISLAMTWLADQGVPRQRVGVLGFCIGGSYAALAAGLPVTPACVVTYYGQLRYPQLSARKPIDPMQVACTIDAPFLGHFGDMDRLIDAGELAEFSQQLRSTQRHHEICIYPGAPHAFDEWFRPAVFRPVASADAWRRTLTFLDWHVRQRISPAAPVLAPLTLETAT